MNVMKDRHLCEWRDGEDRCADVCEYKLVVQRGDGTIALLSAGIADEIEDTSLDNFIKEFDEGRGCAIVKKVGYRDFVDYLEGNFAVVCANYAETYADLVSYIAESGVEIDDKLRKHLVEVLNYLVDILGEDEE